MLNEYTKITLDNIISNVLSCQTIIEKLTKEQPNLLNDLGVTRTRDFILGSIWCIILEKFIVVSYLQSGKTLTYESSIEISRYVLEKLLKSVGNG
jgi:hypothetical protein